MTNIHSLTLEVADVQAAELFHKSAFDLDGDVVRLQESDAPSDGFRGFTISLIVSQPANADALLDGAVAAGATILKPPKKSLWGYGGVVQAPDGTIWKVATSKKKDTAPASRAVEEVVVLLGASDVGGSKQFYVDHGFEVGKSFGKYVDFDLPGSRIKLGLYGRKALAKDAGVPPEGSGAHRLVLHGDGGAFTDPDGFEWR